MINKQIAEGLKSISESLNINKDARVNQKRILRCFYCKKLGHTMKNCYAKARDEANKNTASPIHPSQLVNNENSQSGNSGN
jgi:hypothetical protein